MLTRIIAFLTLLLTALWSAYAAQPTPIGAEVQTRRALAERALQLARAPEMFALQEKSARQRAKDDPRVAPGDYQRVADLIVKWMDSRNELAAIADAIQRQCDVQALQRFNEAYSTPLAVKLNAMSLQAGDPDEQAKIKDFVAQFESVPPNPQRVQLLLRLDELTDASKIIGENLLAMTARMSRAQPGSPRYQQMEAKVREQAVEQTLVMMLFSLRQASNDELKAYVDLHEDPLVAKVASVLTRESMNGIQNMLDRVIESAVLEGPKVMAAPAASSP